VSLLDNSSSIESSGEGILNCTDRPMLSGRGNLCFVNENNSSKPIPIIKIIPNNARSIETAARKINTIRLTSENSYVFQG